MTKPLLSHIIIGRNDDYMGNFKRRLELAVNYICLNIERSGNLGAYELLICDWNSDAPLRQALNLNDAALAATSFLEVPPPLVSRLGLGSRAVYHGVAHNVPVRRAQGDFIMFTPADVLFSYPAVCALFALLRGEINFPADIRRCYMGVERFLIPWQAAERLYSRGLGLEDLDRYLLLHTMSMPLEIRWHGAAAGEGAHLMSHELWHTLRGFNEAWPLWGHHELDMARRAAQFVPQLKATLAGVLCYDFQQRPQQRATLEINKYSDSLAVTLNDSYWGLAQENIPRIPAERCPHANNSGNPPTPYDIGASESAYSYKRKFAALIAKTGARLLKAKGAGNLKTAIFERLFWLGSSGKNRPLGNLTLRCVFNFFARCWVTERKNGKNSQWFCGDWFGEEGRLLSFLAYAATKIKLLRTLKKWHIKSASFALAVLATVGCRRPARFFHAGGRDKWVAQCAVFVDPTLEITSYDHWQEADEISPTIHYAMEAVGFKGYYHLESGPMETAFERLRNTPFAGEPYHCLALDLDFLRPIAERLYAGICPLLADSCAVILGGAFEARMKFGATLMKEGFQLVGALPDASVYTRLVDKPA